MFQLILFAYKKNLYKKSVLSIFENVENVSSDAFPGTKEYVQLESATELASLKYRRSQSVRLVRTQYKAKSVTIAKVEDSWIGIGIGVGVDVDVNKVSWVGNRPNVNSVVIATPKEPTFIKSQSGGEYISLNVNWKLAQNLRVPMPDDLFINPRSFEIPPAVHDRLLNDLVDLFDRSESEFELKTKSLLALIFSNTKGLPSAAVGDTQKRYVQSAIEFIRDKSNDNLRFTVAQVASSVGCSSRTLEYAFKRHLGMPPKRYVDLYRLNRFHERIRGRTQAEIHHIIHIMGYSNASRVLKQHNEFFPPKPSIDNPQ